MNRGMSLIEVLVAASMVSIITLAVLKVSDNMNTMQRSFQETSDIMEVMSTTKLFMEHQSACLQTFSQAYQEALDGKTYIPIKASLDSIKNTLGKPTFNVDKKFGAVEIESISYEPQEGFFEEDEFVETRGLVDLNIRFKSKNPKVKFSKKRTHPVWVYASKKSDEEVKILYCDTSKRDFIEEIKVSVLNEVCHSLNSSYDYKAKGCQFVTEQDQRKMRNKILNSEKFELTPQKLIEIYEKVLNR